MEHCVNCDINYKVEYCCSSHPETGESIALELFTGDVVGACPHLDSEGYCSTYDIRPDGCREFSSCPRLGELDLVDLLRR